MASPEPIKPAASPPGCKLCGGQTAALTERNGFPIVKCPACGFTFAVIPESYDLDAVYNDESYWTGGREWGYRREYDEILAPVLKAYEERLPRIASFQKPARMLELGSAGGHFLRAAKAAGWKPTGVELSAMMRKRSAALVDCPVFASVDEVAAAGARFECVAMWEVIKNLADPLAMLRQLRELMTPGGVVAFSTPNYGAPAGAPDYTPPAAVSYLTHATVRTCLAKAGFELLEIERRLNPEMPLPLAIAALLRPFRSGKRLRPRGIVGRMLKRYQLSRADALAWSDYLVVYARRQG